MCMLLTLKIGTWLYTFKVLMPIFVSLLVHIKRTGKGKWCCLLFFLYRRNTTMMNKKKKTLLIWSIIDRLFSSSSDLMIIAPSNVVIRREKKSVNSLAYSGGWACVYIYIYENIFVLINRLIGMHCTSYRNYSERVGQFSWKYAHLFVLLLLLLLSYPDNDQSFNPIKL